MKELAEVLDTLHSLGILAHTGRCGAGTLARHSNAPSINDVIPNRREAEVRKLLPAYLRTLLFESTICFPKRTPM